MRIRLISLVIGMFLLTMLGCGGGGGGTAATDQAAAVGSAPPAASPGTTAPADTTTPAGTTPPADSTGTTPPAGATPPAASTGKVTLSWDAPASTDIVGYKVYYKADSAVAPLNGAGAVEGASPVNVSKQTTATITGLDRSRVYYFAVTAYNSAGQESAYSNIASTPVL